MKTTGVLLLLSLALFCLSVPTADAQQEKPWRSSLEISCFMLSSRQDSAEKEHPSLAAFPMADDFLNPQPDP
ncbi:hypothetical protein HGM15179_004826 [Zosterops borbonicus]|uniref:Uncharacterized protein n=1 Tax=Zosterops borbonicus TaxID=364589 RepID=A0A8K1GQV5_9PASS|nr:hypothetical protein HGM15179_004826 [Zosterops borbonicus]